jgi:hypothetical protein
MKNEAAVSVIEAIGAASIPYMLLGSYASNVYGVRREPDDVDIRIDLNETSIDELRRLLEPTILIDHELHVEPVSQSHRYNAKVAELPVLIELFLLNDDPHNQEEFRRRRLVDILGRQVWVPTAEDVLVTRLRWSLPFGWCKHTDDACGIITVQGAMINWDYVCRWCELHGSLDLLDEIRNRT